MSCNVLTEIMCAIIQNALRELGTEIKQIGSAGSNKTISLSLGFIEC